MTAAASVPHTPGEWSRTKGEALLDLGYAIELAVLSQRFYERVHKAIALVSLLAGSAAFVTVFQPNSVVVTVAGVSVGVLSLLEQVHDFRGKGTAHAALIKRFQRLEGRAEKLSLAQLDAGLSKIAEDSIPVIQGLRLVAHNNNMRRCGYPERVHPLSRWQGILQRWV